MARRMRNGLSVACDPIGHLQRREAHGVGGGQRQHKQVQVAQRVPEPYQDGEKDAKWAERSLQVVAQVLWIAEVEAGLVMVVDEPQRERNQTQQKREGG